MKIKKTMGEQFDEFVRIVTDLNTEDAKKVTAEYYPKTGSFILGLSLESKQKKEREG